MTQTRTIRTKTGATLAAIGVAALVAACGSSHSSNSGSASSGSSGSTGSAVSGTPASDHTLQISVVSGKDGRYLAGAGGRAIYLWVADGHNKSHCTSGGVRQVLAGGADQVQAVGRQRREGERPRHDRPQRR